MQRHLQHELMDDPSLDAGEHRRALAGLARINVLSDAAAPIWRAINAWHNQDSVRMPPSLLDIASGSGDVLLGVDRNARRHGVSLELHAADLSAEALRVIVERSNRAEKSVTTHQYDATSANSLIEGEPFDIVMCSLFLHHLPEQTIESLLRRMTSLVRPGGLVVISDLERTSLGLLAARTVPRLLTRSHVVHVDAVRSVQGALTQGELTELASCAGMHHCAIRGVWPFRMLLTWQRGHS
jgi:2-polyprenyl-3-methyl-5-hydroxy-6-metoxy-1,4-benzoquinol methylase